MSLIPPSFCGSGCIETWFSSLRVDFHVHPTRSLVSFLPGEARPTCAASSAVSTLHGSFNNPSVGSGAGTRRSAGMLELVAGVEGDVLPVDPLLHAAAVVTAATAATTWTV